jgi:cardiolipin synthase
MRIPKLRTPVLSNPAPAWDAVELFHAGDPFFAALEAAIESAQRTIECESYIFNLDQLGERLLAALTRAAQRGVKVRMVVDWIGSGPWVRELKAKALAAGIECKIYHEFPWSWWGRHVRGSWWSRVGRVLRQLNSRNHRKVWILDGQTAFVGSMNVAACHLQSLSGAQAWRDTGVRVRGGDVGVLQVGFEELWIGTLRRLRRYRKSRKQPIVPSGLVRLNHRMRQRRENYLDLLVRLIRAQRRIYLTNAYFVPDGSLLRALTIAAGAGVDVRIVVPQFSDVVFMPWVAAALHYGLLKAGVRIFEYERSILHAKTVLIDEWGVIGSSNLNHRSLLHDLEADVVVSDSTSCASLEQQFQSDCDGAVEVTLERWRSRPLHERIIGRALLAFRYLL